jgi:magnesium chelatase family protein
MNPCPCGFLGHSNDKCRCTPDQIARYRGKISGPLLDRIDLMIEVASVSEGELSMRAGGDSSSTVRGRVVAARQRQLDRQGKTNAQLGPDEIDQYCAPDEAGSQLLKRALAQLDLSARGYHRVLKVARTVADLAGSENLCSTHIAEAIHYRRGSANV